MATEYYSFDILSTPLRQSPRPPRLGDQLPLLRRPLVLPWQRQPLEVPSVPPNRRLRRERRWNLSLKWFKHYVITTILTSVRMTQTFRVSFYNQRASQKHIAAKYHTAASEIV